MTSLWEYETLFAQQFPGAVICGIDEAGRGPLCGPVCAGAVILPFGLAIEGLNDSKKLSEKKRNFLYQEITQKAVAWSVGTATPEEIDELNILNATFLAMRRAVAALSVSPTLALVDGNRIKGLKIPAECIVKGDAKSASIAAASIVAKVTRDRIMQALAEEYPQYCLEKHKGYPTKEHYRLIGRYGIAPIYRKTFLKTLERHLNNEEK